MTRLPIVRNIGGVPFRVSTLSDTVETIVSIAKSSGAQGTHVHFANAYSISLTLKSEKLLAVYRERNSICFPDGKPISLISKIRWDKPFLNQVRGPSLFREFFSNPSSFGIRHYLAGGSPEVLGNLEKRLSTHYGAHIAGSYSPPFREPTDEDILHLAKKIIRSQAQVIWLGLGTPKQDFVASRLAQLVPGAVVAIGAAFDFEVGSLKVAPKWMQSAGLEWVHRFLAEPKRLWKRYFFGNLIFLVLILLRGKK